MKNASVYRLMNTRLTKISILMMVKSIVLRLRQCVRHIANSDVGAATGLRPRTLMTLKMKISLLTCLDGQLMIYEQLSMKTVKFDSSLTYFQGTVNDIHWTPSQTSQQKSKRSLTSGTDWRLKKEFYFEDGRQ